MSLELCILASGSSGNCTILRSPQGIVLIDIGIGPRTTAKRMAGTGVTVAQVAAICLTHLDGDHFRPTWLNTIAKQAIRVFCHTRRVQDLLRMVIDHDARREIEKLLCPFDGVPFEALAGVRFHPIRLPHDQAGSHGFRIEGFGCRIGYATDLGRVPDALVEHFTDVDILAMESNYDPEMELGSRRPQFLKKRIMGGHGHLSNEQAMQAIARILDRCNRNRRSLPQHVVLLHRSQECNCPKLVRRFFERDSRIANRLTLAEQHARTAWLRAAGRSGFGQQLQFTWG